MNKKYQSEQLMVCHETAQALHEIGAITDAEMKEYDDDCLVHEPASPSTDSGSPKQSPSPAYAHPRR
jgi:DNA-binding transcriptional regulator YiaG